ncbi:MAG: rod shape-determining protein MreC [Solirubrobacteraceae bacterium]
MHDKQVRRRRAVLASLVAVSLILLTAYFGKSPSSPLHGVQRGIVQVLSPVQAGASKVLSPVRDVANWVSQTLHAKSQVNRLNKEVAQLTAENAQLRVEDRQNAQLTALLGVDRTIGLFNHHLVGANVIERDPNLWYQQVEIDAGTDEGVALNDPVVAAGGLAGLVTTVGSSYAIVSLITDPSVQVGAEVLSTGSQGVIAPSVGNPNQLLLQDLPGGAQINPGDRIVTSGFKTGKLASYYPAGIPIGTVPSAQTITSTQLSNDVLNNGSVPVIPFAQLRTFDSVQVLTGSNAGNARAQVP